MPFSCKFQLNNKAISSNDKVVFGKFIESSFGKFHEAKVNIAEVIYNNQIAFITSNCPCFVSSPNKALERGTIITETTVIGYFSANGEDIPYNRPYAIIKPI